VDIGPALREAGGLLSFYFLEMNTRLQVEHPVTEQITGIDLVKEQIRIAQGEHLNIKQEDLSINGHAIEVRVYAEDAKNNFMPDTGKLITYKTPKGPGIRVDDGFEQGMEIPIYYDPMIAKLITHAATRSEAIEKMKRAIDEYQITGIETTLPFGKFVMDHEAFRSGEFDTSFVEKYYMMSPLTGDHPKGWEDARLPKQSGRQGKCLVKAKNIFCTFNIKDLISGNYVIDEIWLENAKIFLRIDKDGNNNFTVFEPGITGTSESKPLTFELQKIYFKNVLFLFDNQQTKQTVHFLSTGTNAGLRYERDLLNISLNGDLFLYKIQLDKSTWFSKKNISLECDLIYNKRNEILKINPSVLQVENSEFGIKGKWVGGRLPAEAQKAQAGGTKDKQKIDYINLSIEGKKTTAQTILSLLPGDLYEKFSVYKSQGSVYFSGKIIGNISETATPAIDILFGFNNASFYLPAKSRQSRAQASVLDSKHSIKKVNLSGKFSNGKKHNQSSSSLTLSGIKAELDGKPLKGSFLIKNFDSPYISLKIDANIDIATLLAFYPNERIDQANGTLTISMALSGGLEQLKRIDISKNFNTSGEFSIRNLDLALKNISLNFKNFNGNFLFNKNDIAATNFTGKIGKSDFLMVGFFKNLIPYLLFEDQTLYMEADLRSDLLDLDELLNTSPPLTPPKGGRTGQPLTPPMGGVKDSNDIYYSTIKDDGTWTNAVKISSRPPNGKYLLMSLDRDDGYGERDLYVISPPESEKRRMGETEKRGRQVTDSPIHPRLPALGEGLVGGQAFTDSVRNSGVVDLGGAGGLIGVFSGYGPLTDWIASVSDVISTRLTPHHKIPLLMSAVDLLILPSYDEGMPTVLIEAGAAGLLVIGSAVGGITDLLADGRGLLIEPGSVKAIVEAINKVRSDYQSALQRAGKLKKYVEKHYNVDKSAEIIINEYKNLIQKVSDTCSL